MKVKKIIFCLQILEESISCAKIIFENHSYKVFLKKEKLLTSDDDKNISGKIQYLLKELNFHKNHKIVFYLPRYLITTRYLHLPANDPLEIENIIKLQKLSYLPYSQEELIQGYDIIATDEKGYSKVILYLVHQNLINRYVNILKNIKIKIENIILSSYGLLNWYAELKKESIAEPVAVCEVDFPYVEFIVISGDKLIFSRAFKLSSLEDLSTQIQLTCQTYEKESLGESIKKIILTGQIKNIDILKKELGQIFVEQINLNSDFGMPSLIGMGLASVRQSLNFLPLELKEENKISQFKKEFLKSMILVAAILFIIILLFQQNIYNRNIYLKELESKLKNINVQVKDMGPMEQAYDFYKYQGSFKPDAIDIICEVYKIIPMDVSLVSLNYQDKEFVILKGFAKELSSAFKLVNMLEDSIYFKNINLEYINKEKIKDQDFAEFEIICPVVLEK